MKEEIKSNADNNLKPDSSITRNRLGRFLAVILVMLASTAAFSYTAVNVMAENRSNERVSQISYKSDIVYDITTGYYMETIVTTSSYYDAAMGCDVISVETVYNYYNYDGYTYELVMSNRNTENSYIQPTPAPVPDYQIPVQTPYPPDNIYVRPTQTPVYDEYDEQTEEEDVDFDTSPLSVSVKRKSSTKALVKWKTNENAHGYYIFRANSEEGKYKKVGTVKDNSVSQYNDKKLKSGKIYYYKVQAYMKNDSGTLTSDMSEPEQVSTIKTQQIINKLKKLKKKYPDGKYWNHVGYRVSAGQSTYGYVTKSPCNHRGSANGIASTCNKYTVMLDGKLVAGYQCYGFANLIGDKLFGKSKIKTHKSYKKSKVGDHVRYSGHSVVITEKHSKYIKVAECNIGGTCMIKWGRKISKAALDNATYYTRY